MNDFETAERLLAEAGGIVKSVRDFFFQDSRVFLFDITHFATLKNPRLLHPIALSKLSKRSYADALNDYKLLVESNPSNLEYVAGFVLAATHVDVEAAKKFEGVLPNFDISTSGLDVDQIEAGAGVSKYKFKDRNSEETAMLKKKKKKKKQKTMLPKNFDPSKVPDPERWLPKILRKSAQKGKKRGTESGKGNQGVMISGGGIGGTGSARIKYVDLLRKMPFLILICDSSEDLKTSRLIRGTRERSIRLLLPLNLKRTPESRPR